MARLYVILGFLVVLLCGNRRAHTKQMSCAIESPLNSVRKAFRQRRSIDGFATGAAVRHFHVIASSYVAMSSTAIFSNFHVTWWGCCSSVR